MAEGEQSEPVAQQPTPNEKLTIVGIGASAGGLAALKTLLGQIEPSTGLAFVVVMHLSPEHESHLASLLQPHCRMPVQQVTSTVELRPDNVYIIPPNANLNTVDTHLRLSKLEEKRLERAPIDHFFRTLAESHDGRSIGVILTGTGSDGTMGLRLIKEKGGVTLVQSPNEAEYDAMPRSAIASGVVDLVLPLRELASHLVGVGQTYPRVQKIAGEIRQFDDQERILQKIFAQVRARTGHDFNQYKRSTIMRRVGRRMQLHQIEELPEYLELLRNDRSEVVALFEDLLITVTEFFRDPDVYELLAKRFIPELFQRKDDNGRIRVWSVGCSTGEEAFTLAMLLLEEAARRELHPQLQIFASDLHETSLKRAREAIYPETIASVISEERLKRFFTKENGSYRIRKEVREMVVFAPHNLLKDPPFSHLDLVVCRNVLIYLQRDIQHDVIALFHYALQPDGLLVLGTSETVDNGELFACEEKRHCIYRRRNVPTRDPHLPVFPTMPRVPSEQGEATERSARTESYGSIHAKMLEQYAPPSMLLSQRFEIVHYSEAAGKYLQMPGGEPTSNVFKLLREPLRVELRAALHLAEEQQSLVPSQPVQLLIDGEDHWVVLRVRVADDPDKRGFAVVFFDEVEEPKPNASAAGDGELSSVRAREVEAELELYRQRLQALIEEYETSQEEMQASNEELQSTNEELRSTLEELETSKEELQSMNEELTTVNQENRHRVEELGQLSNDLQNLLAATDIATLFLDRKLCIVRFTPRVGELFNVRHSDRGRPLSDITHRLGDVDLQRDAQDVLDRLIPIEREVRSDSGHWFLARVLPYRVENRIDGVVVTFIDVTARKNAETARGESEERLRLALAAARMGTWEWQVASDRHRRDANLNQLLGLEPIETVQPIEQFYLHVHLDDRAWLREKFAESVRQGRHLQAEFRIVLPDGSIRWLRDQGDVFRGLNEQVSSMAGACIDVTDRRLAEEALRASEERLRRMVNVPGVGVLTFSGDGTLLRANDAFTEMTGYSREAIESGRLTWRDMTPKEFVEISELQLKQLPSTGRIGPYEKECIHKDGSRTWMLYAGASLGDGTIVEYCIDVTDRRIAEEALRESEEQLRSLVESATDFAILTLDSDRKVTTWSPGATEIFGYTPEEIVGHSADILFTEEDRAAGAPEEEARTALATGRAADERWHLRKDGSRFFASGVLTPLQDGGFRGYAKVARDLTARKHMEDSLRDASQQLKSRVDEQTAELLQSNRARVALLRRLSIAQEQERLRLSRELHDHIGQLITGLILNLRVAENELNAGDSPQNAATRLSGLKEIVEELGREVHEVALRLRPTALDDLGLVAAVKNYVEHWSAQAGIEAEFYSNFDERLPGEIETALYRVVQESLNNALKHAQASRVSVLLERRKDHVVAIVEDNGAGFDDHADAAQGRLGLQGMRERLLAIDGELEIESAPGTGVTIFARVPLSQETE